MTRYPTYDLLKTTLIYKGPWCIFNWCPCLDNMPVASTISYASHCGIICVINHHEVSPEHAYGATGMQEVLLKLVTKVNVHCILYDYWNCGKSYFSMMKIAIGNDYYSFHRACWFQYKYGIFRYGSILIKRSHDLVIFIYIGGPYTGKTTSLYRNGPLHSFYLDFCLLSLLWICSHYMYK